MFWGCFGMMGIVVDQTCCSHDAWLAVGGAIHD